MTNSNVIIKAPSSEAVDALLTGSKTFTAQTAEDLFSLTPKDRQKMNKAADKTAAFVEKGVYYIANDPQFCPSSVNQNLLKIEGETVAVLLPLQKVLTDLLSKVTDTITLARSEQLRNVRKYYNSVAQAARENEPGAKTIYEDMNKRFKGQGRRKSKKEKPASAEDINVVA